MSILEKFGIKKEYFARMSETELELGVPGWMHRQDTQENDEQTYNIQSLLIEIYGFMLPGKMVTRSQFLRLPKEERKLIANYIRRIKKDYGI